MANTVLRRVTLNLIPAASDALDRSADRDRLSHTDIVNRALQVYDRIMQGQADGHDLIERDRDGNTLTRIEFL